MVNGNITYTNTIAGALAINGDPQYAAVGFTGRYLKFECLSYGTSAGLSSLLVMGNEVLKITSCECSDSSTERECHYAIDQITTEANNGWVEHPYKNEGLGGANPTPGWIVFNIGGAPQVSRIGFISGIGREDKSVTDFAVEVKTGGIYEEVTNFRFMTIGHNVPTNQNIIGNRGSCDPQDNTQVSFTPVSSVEAVKFTVFASNDADDNNALVNEFYVYRSPPPPTPAPTPPPTYSCVGQPAGWVSAGGSDCATYYLSEYCTLSGGYGAGWEESYGTFDLWAVSGIGPVSACCGCGGGALEKCNDFDGWVAAGGSSCEEFAERQWCTAEGDYGAGWLPVWGTFADSASSGVNAILACCGCGGGCTDTTGWIDSKGYDCATYVGAGWCTPRGGYGPQWDMKEWGTFDMAGTNYLGADEACCGCGGGAKAPCGNFKSDTMCPPSHCKWTGTVCEKSDEPQAVWPPPGVGCDSTPAHWKSAGGSSCAQYASEKYCTPQGTYGTGWEVTFATFDIWATDGNDALMACCECGGGSTRGDPTPEQVAENYHYVKVGKGYCGSTKEEELANRISSWFYDQTKEDAERNCNSDPNCEGFHWSVKNSHYVLVGKVGVHTCCDTQNQDVCYKKHGVTPAPTAGPTVYQEPYFEVGRGYCGTTEEEEIGNRIGTWVYVNGTKLAGEACTLEPLCQGFHWNVWDSSYVLLSKVSSSRTCCETNKGDRCMKRMIPWDGVIEEAPYEAPEGQVVFSMVVSGVDFLPIIGEFTTACKEAIAAEAGSDISPANVEVVVSERNTVQVTITPPQGVHARVIQSALTSSPTLTESIMETLKQIPDIDTHINGAIMKISDLTAPAVQAVFTGDAAQGHLDEAWLTWNETLHAPPTTATTTTTEKRYAPGEYRDFTAPAR
jgi:hypothetical protein